MHEREDWAPGGGDFNEEPEWVESWKQAMPLSEGAQAEVDRITGEAERRKNLADRLEQAKTDT